MRQPTLKPAHWVLLGLVFGIAWPGAPLAADDKPPATPKEIKQIRRLQESAKQIGSWDQQYGVIAEATDNVFEQQGWNSPEDVWIQNLMRDAGQIPPWKPHERSNVFMDGVQVRYGLTHDQRTLFRDEMQRAGMDAMRKHFKTALPIMMEVVATRAKQQPFTADQVQRWSRAFKPVMEDSLKSLNNSVDKLKKTMTAEQRRQLDADMKALYRRHRDAEKMVAKWQAGNWNPTDWGLQNDPLHAAAMVEHRAQETEKNRAVEEARLEKAIDEGKIATAVSAWDLYVRRFCDKHGCTDMQRTQAESILRGAKKEARDILAARADRIQKTEQLCRAAETAASREKHSADMERLLVPVGLVFNRMKAQLEQVLTTAQRKEHGVPPAVQTSRPTD